MLVSTESSNLHFKQEGGLFNNILIISVLENRIRFREWTLKNGEIDKKILDMVMTKKIIDEINRIYDQYERTKKENDSS